MSQIQSITQSEPGTDTWQPFEGFVMPDLAIEGYRHSCWNWLVEVEQRCYPFVVYLLHMESPVSPYSPARHYMGLSTPYRLDARLCAHALGTSKACIMQAATERGINFRLVRTWYTDDPSLERILKASKNLPRYCPLCKLARFTEKYLPTPLSALFASEERLQEVLPL